MIRYNLMNSAYNSALYLKMSFLRISIYLFITILQSQFYDRRSPITIMTTIQPPLPISRLAPMLIEIDPLSNPISKSSPAILRNRSPQFPSQSRSTKHIARDPFSTAADSRSPLVSSDLVVWRKNRCDDE